MASYSDTLNGLTNNQTYPGVDSHDSTFTVQISGDGYELQAVDVSGLGDLAVRSSGAAWNPYDSSYGVQEHYLSTNVVKSGANITQITDLSGNGHHLTKTQNPDLITITLDGNQVIEFQGEATLYSATFTNASNTRGFTTILLLGGTYHSGNYTVYGNRELDVQGVSGSENLYYTGGLTLTNGAPFDDIALSTWRHDNNYSGPKYDVWLNGDISNLVNGGGSGGSQDHDYVYLYGATGSHYAGSVTLKTNVSQDVIQRWEAYIIWSFYALNKKLVSTHPYRYFAPTGVVTPPAAPTLQAVPSDGGAFVRIIPGADNGADQTWTVTSSPGSIVRVTNNLDADYSGVLTNGTTYTFTAVASNAAGNSSASSGASCTPRNAGTWVSFWNMSARVGTETDVKGSNNLTSTGGAGVGSSGSGFLRRARRFGGSTCLVKSSPSNALAGVGTDFTVLTFFKPSSVSGNQQIITVRDSGGGEKITYMLRLQGTDLYLFIGDGNGPSLQYSYWSIASGISVGTWYGVCFNVKNSTKEVRYSINGGSVGSQTSSFVPVTASGLTFGIGGMDTSQTFIGLIDCTGVSNELKSDSLLQQLSQYGIEY